MEDVGLEKYLTYKQKCLLILAGSAVTQQSEHNLNDERSISLKQREGSSSISTLLHQLRQQSTPFLPEEVGPRQTAISTDHTQVGDAVLNQVVSCLQASLVGAKLFTPGTANNCPTLKTTGVLKVQL